jgi:hypothetical protein
MLFNQVRRTMDRYQLLEKGDWLIVVSDTLETGTISKRQGQMALPFLFISNANLQSTLFGRPNDL